MHKDQLDIEDEVLQADEELTRREGSTVGQIISALARRGLSIFPEKSRKPCGPRGGVLLLQSRGELVALEHIEKLMEMDGI